MLITKLRLEAALHMFHQELSRLDPPLPIPVETVMPYTQQVFLSMYRQGLFVAGGDQLSRQLVQSGQANVGQIVQVQRIHTGQPVQRAPVQVQQAPKIVPFVAPAPVQQTAPVISGPVLDNGISGPVLDDSPGSVGVGTHENGMD